MFPHCRGFSVIYCTLACRGAFKTKIKNKPDSGKLAACIGRRQDNKIYSGVCAKDGSMIKGPCHQASNLKLVPGSHMLEGENAYKFVL